MADPGFNNPGNEVDISQFSRNCEAFARGIERKGELSDEDRAELVKLLDAGDWLTEGIRGNIYLYEDYILLADMVSELRQYVLQ